MTGFEPRTSGVGSDRSTNCATTTALLKDLCIKTFFKSIPNIFQMFGLLWKRHYLSKNCFSHILGNFWVNFDHFLFQHLVTLLNIEVYDYR